MIIPADFSARLFGTSTAAQSRGRAVPEPDADAGRRDHAERRRPVAARLQRRPGGGGRGGGLAAAAGNGAGRARCRRGRRRPFIHQSESGTGGLTVAQRPPALAGGKKSKDVGVTGLVLAGMMVFFMFFGASNVARTILDEERAGTLPRLFTTPTPRQLILGGKFTLDLPHGARPGVSCVAAGRLFFGDPLGRARRRVAADHWWRPPSPRASACWSSRSCARRRRPEPSAPASTSCWRCSAATSPARRSPAAPTPPMQRLTPNGWLLDAAGTPRCAAAAVGDIAARRCSCRWLRGRVLRRRGAALPAAVRVRPHLHAGAQGPAGDPARPPGAVLHCRHAARLHGLLRPAVRRRQRPAAAGGVERRRRPGGDAARRAAAASRTS